MEAMISTTFLWRQRGSDAIIICHPVENCKQTMSVSFQCLSPFLPSCLLQDAGFRICGREQGLSDRPCTLRLPFHPANHRRPDEEIRRRKSSDEERNQTKSGGNFMGMFWNDRRQRRRPPAIPNGKRVFTRRRMQLRSRSRIHTADSRCPSADPRAARVPDPWKPESGTASCR